MNTTQKTAVLRLVEQVDRAGVIRLTGAMRADDWKELATLAAECRAVLVADSDDNREWREALKCWKYPQPEDDRCAVCKTETAQEGKYLCGACLKASEIAWGFVTAQGELREVAA